MFAGTMMLLLKLITAVADADIVLIDGVNLDYIEFFLVFTYSDSFFIIFIKGTVSAKVAGNGTTVILKLKVLDILFGLSSVISTLTTYIPGSLLVEFGYTLKLGNFPSIKLDARPKSQETREAVSSKSGSIIDGN
jgi:hypothetical protein